jgi:hypothetical protein
MPLPLELPENCPKILTEPSRFLSVWAGAEYNTDEAKRRVRKRTDLRKEGINISLPTLLRHCVTVIGYASQGQARRLSEVRWLLTYSSTH